MQSIEKTIKSTLPPTLTNVFWLDISGEKPILKAFKNGAWLPVSSEDLEVKELKGMVEELEEGKVDKIEGKELSSNDFTDELKEKLETLDETAEGIHIKPDWNAQSGESGEILNRPGVDNVPTLNSNNLVKSGGVAEKIGQLGQEIKGNNEDINFYVATLAERLLKNTNTQILTPSSTLTSKHLQTSFVHNYMEVADVASDSYIVKVYALSEIDVEYLIVKGSANYRHGYFAFFSSNEFVRANFLGEINACGNNTSAAQTDTFYVKIPESAAYLVVAEYSIPASVSKRIATTDIILGSDLTNLLAKAVRTDITQSFSDEEKAKAASNIGLATPINNLERSMGDIVFSDSEFEKITLSPQSTETQKLILSTGLVDDTSSDDFNVATYNIEGITNKLTIAASKRYTNALYSFFKDTNFSSNDSLLLTKTDEDSSEHLATFENVIIPAGAKYLVVSFYKKLGYGVNKQIPFILNTKSVKNTLFGKKWACVGDSLTAENIRTTKHYFDYVAEQTGVIPVNYGYSGSGYARLREDNKAFYQRIANIDTSVDIVTIFGSFNDLGAITDDFPMGNVDDEGIISVAGCINATLDELFAIKPIVRLGIVAPTPWNTSQPGGDNLRARNYVNLLQSIAERRSIPFLDLWRHSNLRPWDATFRELAYSKDEGSGTHPDETGHSLIAPLFRQFILSLI